MPAHPRVGGENVLHARDSACLGGSSPRRRGKPAYLGKAKFGGRLIPA